MKSPVIYNPLLSEQREFLNFVFTYRTHVLSLREGFKIKSVLENDEYAMATYDQGQLNELRHLHMNDYIKWKKDLDI